MWRFYPKNDDVLLKNDEFINEKGLSPNINWSSTEVNGALCGLYLKWWILYLHNGFCIQNDEFCILNDEICIQNDEFCIYNDEFCVQNDEICI